MNDADSVLLSVSAEARQARPLSGAPRCCAGAKLLSELVNFAHASAGMLSRLPSRSLVSRTATLPVALAASMQLPPFPDEYVDVRHVMLVSSIVRLLP